MNQNWIGCNSSIRDVRGVGISLDLSADVSLLLDKDQIEYIRERMEDFMLDITSVLPGDWLEDEVETKIESEVVVEEYEIREEDDFVLERRRRNMQMRFSDDDSDFDSDDPPDTPWEMNLTVEDLLD